MKHSLLISATPSSSPCHFQALPCYQVLGGADLFLQGFILPEGGLPSFRSADPAAIVVPGNEYPLAVGIMECDTAQARSANMKVR